MTTTGTLTRIEDALGLPGVDIVTVATPPHTHAEILIAAARAGLSLGDQHEEGRDATLPG